MSVNSKMTAIANATRALDGSTAALTMDGIASKLGVEKSNIAAALAAIAEKGVEVPSGSTSDALALLIASIEAGGCKVCAGKLVFAEKCNSNYVITHNLGVTPSFAYIQTISPRISGATDRYQLRLASGWLEKIFLAIKDDPNITFGIQTSFTSNSSDDAAYTDQDITDDYQFFQLANETTITLNFKDYGRIAYAGQVFVYLFISFEV